MGKKVQTTYKKDNDSFLQVFYKKSRFATTKKWSLPTMNEQIVNRAQCLTW